MKKTPIILVLLVCFSTVFAQQVDLKGVWNFKLDPEDVGLKENWQSKKFEETLVLPGSLTTNGEGYDIDLKTQWTGWIIDSAWFKAERYAKFREKDNMKVISWLQPEKAYLGAAWYSRTFTVSKDMSAHDLLLSFERPHWETTVWIDGEKIGMQNALGVPHEFDLKKLKAGEHRLTVRVDNRIKDINVGLNAHSVSDHTQTNWNGIIGDMHVRALEKVAITNTKVYPDVDKKQVRLVIETNNNSGTAQQTNFNIAATSKFSPKLHRVAQVSKQHSVPAGLSSVELIYPMGDDFYQWDEFTPYVYELAVSADAGSSKDSYSTTFGMRKLGVEGTQFTVNDRLTFLRGTLDCAVFPLTGYPPTEVAEWKRIFNVVKSHGLNHVRFHSWCPPKAAFEAADELGVYLQAEGSGWALVGGGGGFDKWIYEESERVLDTYGNHPSFILYTYGNEPDGNKQGEFLGGLVDHLKAYDTRHMYTSGAGWPDVKENDFYNAMYPRLYVWGDGLNSHNNSKVPSTDFDWFSITGKYNVPYVSHEIGQWCVYPNFKEIDKYTGVLKAKNFEVFQETLNDSKLSHLADSFLLASGRHQALTYKADIEAALRTPGFAGFQLLGLNDFPGQGTALVGVLDAFWEEKGYISPEEFKTFSGETVPLVRLPKMVYENNEHLDATVEVAHFGAAALKGVVPNWYLTQEDGEIVGMGSLGKQDIAIGNTVPLGSIKYDLAKVTKPTALELTVEIGKHRNSWKFWVYPAATPDYQAEVHVTDKLDDAAYAVLEKGGSVLLSTAKGAVKNGKGGEAVMGYSPIFWNTAWTRKQPPLVMGVLVDPTHPALELFPTDYHQDFQWWGLVSNANAINLGELGEDIQPIVRIIDDWFSNQSLGLVVEGKLGNGKIIISSSDLIHNPNDRLEVGQMKKSLLNYMNSAAFNPKATFEKSKVEALFK